MGSRKKSMFCKFCRVFPNKARSAMSTGCTSFKHETVAQHAASKSHICCRDDFLHLHNKKPDSLPLVVSQQVAKNSSEIEKSLAIKFNTAYLVAKEELPFTKFKTLLLLQKRMVSLSTLPMTMT